MIRTILNKTTMSIFTIHSSPICPACRSVLMTAKYLNLKLDVKNYNLREGEHKTPEFRKMNPYQTVPTIDDNGFYLWESRAVLAYMMNKYAPDSPVYPKDPQKRAVVDRMLYFDMGTLYRDQFNMLRPVIFKGQPPEADKIETYERTLTLFDEVLGKSPYVAGDQITIADFAIISTLATAQVTLDLTFEKYPNLATWLQKLRKEIPSYEEINEIPLVEYKENLKTRNQ